jgi:hypothetical protein
MEYLMQLMRIHNTTNEDITGINTEIVLCAQWIQRLSEKVSKLQHFTISQTFLKKVFGPGY